MLVCYGLPIGQAIWQANKDFFLLEHVKLVLHTSIDLMNILFIFSF